MVLMHIASNVGRALSFFVLCGHALGWVSRPDHVRDVSLNAHVLRQIRFSRSIKFNCPCQKGGKRHLVVARETFIRKSGDTNFSGGLETRQLRDQSITASYHVLLPKAMAIL